MYQTLTLTLGALFLAALGYFITSSDRTGLVTSNTGSSYATSSSVSLESIQGVYVCDTDSKCSNARILKLLPTGDMRMTTSYADGAETLEEFGTWTIDKEGRVQVRVIGTPIKDYLDTIILPLRKVSAISLVGEPAQGPYEDWVKPIFRKSESERD